jgi:predicted KAP-like P-loop ATPase
MKSKLERIKIDPENPFANCKLDRFQYALPLREIVKSYSDGCVLAINGKWGTGKTTFVKMWQEYLEKYDIRTLYYNAWENDFISDPLVSLLGELSKYNGVDGAKEKMESVVSVAGKIFLDMAP